MLYRLCNKIKYFIHVDIDTKNTYGTFSQEKKTAEKKKFYSNDTTGKKASCITTIKNNCLTSYKETKIIK